VFLKDRGYIKMVRKNLFRLFFALIVLISAYNVSYAMEGNMMNDTAITASIKTKMATDKVVSAFNVKVETKNGIVTLTGNVNSTSEAEAAIDIASSTENVKDIDASGLLIKGSSQPFTDTIITSKIKAEYAREKVFGDKPIKFFIHVETNDGNVVLTGEADNAAQIENAKRLAENVTGVRVVHSNLTVKGP